MLDLDAERESRVREYAKAEGVSVNDLIDRYFPPRIAPRITEWQTPLPDHSAESQRAAIHALLALPKEEIVRQNAPSIAYIEAKLAATKNATPEEIAEAEAEWQAHKDSMNASRKATGERLIYPESSHHDRLS